MEEPPRQRYLACHICKESYPVESVAMLCCGEDKTWEDDDTFWFLLLDGDYVRCNF